MKPRINSALDFSVRLKDLDENTDVEVLTQEVVQRCKLIPSARMPEVEQLIYYLQKRRTGGANNSALLKSTPPPDIAPSANFSVTNSTSQPQERASLNRLDVSTNLNCVQFDC